MDCLQLPCIRVEEAVSWKTHAASSNKKTLAQKPKFIYDKQV